MICKRSIERVHLFQLDHALPELLGEDQHDFLVLTMLTKVIFDPIEVGYCTDIQVVQVHHRLVPVGAPHRNFHKRIITETRMVQSKQTSQPYGVTHDRFPFGQWRDPCGSAGEIEGCSKNAVGSKRPYSIRNLATHRNFHSRGSSKGTRNAPCLSVGQVGSGNHSCSLPCGLCHRSGNDYVRKLK